jgi:transcriptional regulator with XRE-family HTH domain
MKLKEYLREKDITAREFADLIGVDYSSVTRYCAGSRRPEWPILERITVATGGAVTPTDFLSRPRRPAPSAASAAA